MEYNLSVLTNTSNTTSPQHSVSEIQIALYGVLLVLSLFGNILLIAVIFYNENLRTHFNNLIVNMAISDLFVPILAIPFKIYHFSSSDKHSGWSIGGVPGEILCKVGYFLADIAATVSVFTLVIVAIGRYVAIVHPYNVRLRDGLIKKNTYLIALTWLSAMAFYSPYLYYFKLLKNKDETFTCRLEMHAAAFQAHIILSIFLVFVIPFTIMTILYSLMICKLFKRSRDVQEMVNDSSARRRQKRNKQTFFLSILIILGCLLTLGPTYIFYLLWFVIWKGDVFSHIGVEALLKIAFIFQFMFHCSAVVNPCIYFVFVKSFRQGLKCLFGCKKSPMRYRTSTVQTVAQTSASRLSFYKTDDGNEQIEMHGDCVLTEA